MTDRPVSEYQAYLESVVWREKRAKALVIAEHRCQLCNSSHHLHVHHRAYPKILGTEPISDLTVLCEACHFSYHKKIAGKRSIGKKTKSAEIQNHIDELRAVGISISQAKRTARATWSAKHPMRRRPGRKATLSGNNAGSGDVVNHGLNAETREILPGVYPMR